jgi:hypothetical protein
MGILGTTAGRAKQELLPSTIASSPVMFSCEISLRVRVFLLTIFLIFITALSILCSQLLVVSQSSSTSAAATDYWAMTTAYYTTINAADDKSSSLNSETTTRFLSEIAAIDPSERLMRQQTQDLLAAQIPSEYDRRQFYASTKDPQYNFRVQLAQISTSRYIPFWPQFKRLLRTWAETKSRSVDPQQVMHSLVSQIQAPIRRHYQQQQLDSGTREPEKQQQQQPSRLNQTTQMISRYRNCAVVGNSGILLQQSYGSAIDAHEMVMRLNNARTVGFEKFVGSKTTISFLNSNIFHRCSFRGDCFCHPYGANVPIVLYICQVIHLMDIAMCGNVHKAAPLLVTDPLFDSLIAKIVKWYSVKEFMQKTGESFARWNSVHDGENFHYSSGMQAVMLAMGICEEVDLFGFGKADGSQHHYHTRQKEELGLHDYEAEYKIYEHLSSLKQQQKQAPGDSNFVATHKLPFLNGSGFELPPLHVFR